MLRDKLVLGTRLAMARESLFRKEHHKHLTIKTVMRTLGTYEDNERALAVIENDRQKMSHARESQEEIAVLRFGGTRGRPHSNRIGRDKQQTGAHRVSRRECRKCGTTYQPSECPTAGQTCRVCNKRNHFARVCISRRRQNQTVKMVQSETEK